MPFVFYVLICDAWEIERPEIWQTHQMALLIKPIAKLFYAVYDAGSRLSPHALHHQNTRTKGTGRFGSAEC